MSFHIVLAIAGAGVYGLLTQLHVWVFGRMCGRKEPGRLAAMYPRTRKACRASAYLAVVLALFGPFQMAAAPAVSGGGTSTWSVVSKSFLLYVLPGLLILAVGLFSEILWLSRRAKYLHLSACDRRIGVTLCAVLLIQQAALCTMLMFMSLQCSHAHTVAGFFGVLGSVMGLVAVNRLALVRIGYGTPSRLVEMEPSPLQSEILQICKSFGWRPSSVRILLTKPQGRRLPGESRLLRSLAAGRFSTQFHPSNPVVPLEILQELDPDSITAAVAYRCTQVFDPLPWIRVRGVHLVRPATLFIAPALLLGIQLLAGVSPLVLWPPFVMAFIFLNLLWIHQRERRNCMLDAFDTWQAADPNANRTEEQFVAHLVRLTRDILCIGPPDIAMRFTQPPACRRYHDFLVDTGCEKPEEVFDRVEQLLRADWDPGPACEPAAMCGVA